jgi:hypothetical protein
MQKTSYLFHKFKYFYLFSTNGNAIKKHRQNNPRSTQGLEPSQEHGKLTVLFARKQKAPSLQPLLANFLF